MLQAQGGWRQGLKHQSPVLPVSAQTPPGRRNATETCESCPSVSNRGCTPLNINGKEVQRIKMRAAQGRFPPPSFSRATALRTQVHSPSNPSSASSCAQSTEPMLHKHSSDCANAHSWQKQRTGREPVKLKGSLAPHNPVTDTCHHNLCIPGNTLIQRPR